MTRTLRKLTGRDIPDHEERLDAARARAQYDIGDPSWALIIIDAYLNPTEDQARLKKELSDD